MASTPSKVHSSDEAQHGSDNAQQQVTHSTVDPMVAPSTLQVDYSDDSSSDIDSAFAGSTGSTSDFTASLSSSVRQYTYENGRRYHAYRAGQYVFPNDEVEQDRLDLAHHIFKMLLHGALYRAPLAGTPENPRPNPQRILDVGTGTGFWAIEIADEFPEATVIGTDLSPIQPGWVPPNCSFYVDDAQTEWTFGEREGKFDFIHGRGLAGGIGDWTKLYQQMYQHLKPGGWVEMQEYNCRIGYNDEETARKAVWCRQWVQDLDVSSRMFGKRLDVADLQKGWLEEAGFVEVTDYVARVPIGRWAKDRKLKEMGQFMKAVMMETAESFTLQLYTRVLGKSVEETHATIANIRREICDPELHMYISYHFVCARKPGKS